MVVVGSPVHGGQVRDEDFLDVPFSHTNILYPETFTGYKENRVQTCRTDSLRRLWSVTKDKISMSLVPDLYIFLTGKGA